MKAFHFTLEAVRTVRLRLEQTAQEHYAQALLARQTAIRQLEAISRESAAVADELREKFKRGCTAVEAAQNNDYQTSLNRRREEASQNLGTAERRVNAALQNMLAARQQREIVDKFLQNQKTRHAREETREEQKLLDELAGRRVSSAFSPMTPEISL